MKLSWTAVWNFVLILIDNAVEKGYLEKSKNFLREDS
jgi:hypothetical protein